MSDPQPLRGLLERFTRSMGAADPGVAAPVFSRWPQLVGDAVAAHARPVGLRDGVLTVSVDDPAWATQLRFLEADLCQRIAAVAGEGAVRELVVRVAPRRG